MEKARIEVYGIVQGVGFRPFVYRLAKGSGVKGYVKNSGNGVEILAIGGKMQIRTFLDGMKDNTPPLAKIDGLSVSYNGVGEYGDFSIIESDSKGKSESVLPPDVCICETCLDEIKDEGNRRNGYPFTVCVDCGARYTIIEDIPYDRKNTSMVDFGLCDDCYREYNDPMDRRFHAEPTCCPLCGPKYYLYHGKEKMGAEDPIGEAVRRLEEGYIVAIMGVGGTHLASNLSDDVILRLREKFGRREKPFAIMARDLKAVEEFSYLNELEKELLATLRRPILVLDKKDGFPPLIAPGLENTGVMLPYTALHHLMFDCTEEKTFIMTSANLPGEPMFTSPDEVIASGFSDYSLVHDRRIVNRVDDSVIRVVDGRRTFIRRSRGYVPEPINLSRESDEVILGLGAELNVVGCLLIKDKAFLTQYVGDTTRFRTLEFLERAVERLLKLTRSESPDRIVIDLHPSYATRSLGEELADKYKTPLVEVQHHLAHAASLMAESHLDEVVCLSLDGAGYGLDGQIWGGEVIYSKGGEMERYASLEPQLMPGGDLATIYPGRMLAGILHPHYPEGDLKDLLSKHVRGAFRPGEIDLVLKQLDKRFNTPSTTSTGRVLDATAAMLGACYERSYEGEPAMKLEALAKRGKPTLELPIKFIKTNGHKMLDTSSMLISAVEMMGSESKEDIAASIQNSIARGLSKLAIECAVERKIDAIGISGGVAYNDSMVARIRYDVIKNGFEFHAHTKAPPGDGGISLGQCWYPNLSG
ncbi:MAG: carbamoyltransferase HypF [Candidatus Hydrothermarchaeaceae archaeon]